MARPNRRPGGYYWTVAFLLLGLQSLTAAEKRYVDPKSSGPQSPYTTPQTAAHDLHAALEVAESGDTVLVAAGTYPIDSRR